MGAIADASANLFHKFLFIQVTQILQHSLVDEIERGTLLPVVAHHTACKGFIQKLLALLCYVLQDQRLGIMLPVPLGGGRLREMKGT